MLAWPYVLMKSVYSSKACGSCVGRMLLNTGLLFIILLTAAQDTGHDRFTGLVIEGDLYRL